MAEIIFFFEAQHQVGEQADDALDVIEVGGFHHRVHAAQGRETSALGTPWRLTKILSVSAPPPPSPAQPSGLPWPWIGAGALLFIAALARLVVLRGRRAG